MGTSAPARLLLIPPGPLSLRKARLRFWNWLSWGIHLNWRTLIFYSVFCTKKIPRLQRYCLESEREAIFFLLLSLSSLLVIPMFER